MLKIPTRAPAAVAQKVQVPDKPTQDVGAVVTQAMQQMTHTMAQVMQKISEQQGAIRTPATRLEADIVRDKSGKMTKIIITPIH